MRSTTIIHIISCHAEGEVGDVIVSGVTPPPGNSIWEQSRWIDQDQVLRQFILNEPRGGVFRHANLLVPSKNEKAEFGFIIMVSWAFASMGLVLGQLSDSWDQLAMMQNFFLTPLSFLGGVFYSVNMLPDWAQTLSFFNPIYYMINGIRFTILGIADSPPMTSFTMALIMTIFFTLSAIILMHSGRKIKQ